MSAPTERPRWPTVTVLFMPGGPGWLTLVGVFTRQQDLEWAISEVLRQTDTRKEDLVAYPVQLNHVYIGGGRHERVVEQGGDT